MSAPIAISSSPTSSAASTSSLTLSDIDTQLLDLQTRRTKLLQKRERIIHAATLAKEKTLPTQDWTREDFTWSSKIKEQAQKHYHVTSFREKQMEVINATMSGRDVCAVMATGYGKIALIGKGIASQQQVV